MCVGGEGACGGIHWYERAQLSIVTERRTSISICFHFCVVAQQLPSTYTVAKMNLYQIDLSLTVCASVCVHVGVANACANEHT